MIFQRDGRQVQQPAFFAKPYIVAHYQFPGECNLHVRFDDDSSADASPESPQHPALQRGKFQRTELEQAETDQQPKELFNPARTAIKTGGGKGREIYRHTSKELKVES